MTDLTSAADGLLEGSLKGASDGVEDRDSGSEDGRDGSDDVSPTACLKAPSRELQTA
jgi:hypothetical protein